MSVNAALEASVANGRIPSLEDLGGVDAVLKEQAAIVSGPFLDVLVETIVGEPVQNQTLLLELVADGFLKADQPAVFHDAVKALLADPELRNIARQNLVDVLNRRVEVRQPGKDALTAAYALEALFCYGLEDHRTKLRTLLLFDDLRSDEDGLFAQHAARIVGVAYHHWGEDELRNVLVRLQSNDEAADEAAFELAMVAFAIALNANEMAKIERGMSEARALFMSVLQRDANRLDASMHVSLIDIVQSFSMGKDSKLSARIDELRRLMAERHDQLGMGQTPDWLTPRVERESEWWSLLRLLKSIDSNINRESWRDAGKVLEQVLAIYDVEHTVSIGGALHTLFAPRIEAAFVRRKGLAAHLYDFLDDEDWCPAERPVAVVLQNRIAQRAEDNFLSRQLKEDGAFPELSAVLQDRDILCQVPMEMAKRLEIALADKRNNERLKVRRDVQSICSKVSDGLVNASDYRGDVRNSFDQLVQQTIAFCEDRQNADLAQLGERGAYLRKADAVENDLQKDLREWLRGNMTAVDVMPEIPGIAAGRSDLYVDFGDAQFVIELKKHHGIVNDDVARSYRAQAVAYQATGPKLGMLGILELVDRPGPPPSLVECIWTNSYIPEGSDLVRHLVVFRVPGRLKTPSTMK
ncbi:hypothetical protein [Shimia thalassica]|uniref:hypothetical protein n=1 Tax=Shimia thalassica TaxID=1715693 RepID=UPI002494CAC4|nr:hypothetical protein [Shimia thalassica]